tara:strand:+ start:10079 stop:10249 length:171 start_codon:yes stop_codon:yes gene_type:complete
MDVRFQGVNFGRGGYCDNPFCRKWIAVPADDKGEFVQCPYCGEISELRRKKYLREQ